MAVAVQVIAAVLALAGLAGFFYGTDLLPTERGIAYTISSVIALSAAAVTGALSLVVRRLDRLSEQLKGRRPEVAMIAPEVAPQPPVVTDQPELPLIPPAPATPPLPPEPVAPPPPTEIAKEAVVAPVAEPVAPSVAVEPVAPAPVAEPKRGRFRLPGFRRGSAIAAGVAAGAVAAGGDAAATIKERPEEVTADGDPAKVIAQVDEAAVVESSAGAHEAIEAAEPAPFRLPRPQAPASQVVADGEPEPEPDRPKAEGAASTQRPRIDFAPVDEKHRPRKAEPPLAPPRLPKVAAAATDEAPPTAADAVPQPAAKPVDDPFEALEAEFDKFIPLKAAPVAREPEPELGPYVEADVDRPDEALKIALSDEPVLSDGLPPEAPPAPAPGASALRGGLAGPIELEERELAPPGVEVIGSYESGGARYTMYSDGSVVVEIDGKTLKFGSLEQLREFIEAGAGKG